MPALTRPVPARRDRRPGRLAARAACLLAVLPGLLLLDVGGGAAATASAPVAATTSPTNGRIVFSDDRDGDREIYSVNPDGTGLLQLTDNAASDTAPRWSRDGTRVAFVRDHALYVMDADGSGQTLVAASASAGQPAWSPDRTRIAYARAGQIWVVNADGTDPAPVATPQVGTHEYEMPEWHPDGSKIAYLARKGPGVASVDTVWPDGTHGETLIDSYAFTPRWARDGAWLAYEDLGLTTRSPEGVVDRVVFLNGGEEGDLEGLSWAPDQSGFVYAQRRYDPAVGWTHPEIKTVSADGTGIGTLTPGWEPDWQAVVPAAPAEPDTTIGTTVPAWALEQPAIGFTSDTDGATFECRLDSGQWAACAPPYVPAWQPGVHVVQVRAVSDEDVRDATPAELRWTTPYDDRRLRPRGRWASRAGDGYYRSTARVSRTRGASLVGRRVSASELVLVATRCPGCGKVDVHYGKQRLKRVSLASPSTKHRSVIRLGRWATLQQAKMVRVVVVTKGKQVVIDGLGVR